MCYAQVDLAELLAGYIDDLQTVTVSFDGGETTINFAQAALVLQGTASIYCKKVDFLWQVRASWIVEDWQMFLAMFYPVPPSC